MNSLTHQGYTAGHPWYYLLGGYIPPIKAIRTRAISGDYAGCFARLIHEADAKPEPKRTEALRYMRNRTLGDLWGDISRYRECARELRKWRDKHAESENLKCSGVHTAISLKFNHILNDFANLHRLDNLPKQGDLFDQL
jgi:hypothetical protein